MDIMQKGCLQMEHNMMQQFWKQKMVWIYQKSKWFDILVQMVLS